MFISPVIVVGLPRSGTSFVSKCLVDHFGVRMQLAGYAKPGEEKLKGQITYEDRIIVKLNNYLFANKITEKRYEKELTRYFELMREKSILWGFKDPRIWVKLGWIIKHLHGQLTIIRTKRDNQLVVNSHIKNLGYSLPQSMFIISSFEKEVNKILENVNHHIFNFGNSVVTENDFINQFEKIA